MWRDLELVLREHPAHWMIWEANPLPDTLQRLEGIGLRSVVYETCGAAPEQGDFLSVMRANAGRLGKSATRLGTRSDMLARCITTPAFM